MNKILYKIKKFFIENYRFYIPLIIIILLLFSIFLCINGLTLLTEYSTYKTTYTDTDTDNITTYTYNNIIYDDAIYVHKDGDNSTGDNWEEAYTNINGAYFETSSDLNDKTIIFVGLGLFDINLEDQLDITKISYYG